MLPPRLELGCLKTKDFKSFAYTYSAIGANIYYMYSLKLYIKYI